MAPLSPIERRSPESLRLLNCHDVADMLGLNPRTVRRMALAGRFPRVELGHRTIRFRLTDVLEFIEASTTNDQSPVGEPGSGETITGVGVAGHVASG